MVRATAIATLFAIGVALVSSSRPRPQREKPAEAPPLPAAIPPTSRLTSGTVSPEAELKRQIERLVADDPCRAMDLIGELPEDALRDEIACEAAARWAGVEPKGVLAWLQEMSDERLKPRLIAAVGFELAQANPASAIETTQRLVDGRERRLLLVSIAESWASLDPSGAASWAEQLPADATRELLRWSVARGAALAAQNQKM